MENASRALIMAASVLLGVMIISVGVALFHSFSDFGRTTIEKTEDAKIAEWNTAYLKYYGTVAEVRNGKVISVPIPVTAHDIVSVINNARQNNVDYFGEDTAQWPQKNENYYYVQVEIKGRKDGIRAETWSEETKNKFLEQNSLTNGNKEVKYYKCTNYEISSATKRVIYIQFMEYDQ